MLNNSYFNIIPAIAEIILKKSKILKKIKTRLQDSTIDLKTSKSQEQVKSDTRLRLKSATVIRISSESCF